MIRALLVIALAACGGPKGLEPTGWVIYRDPASGYTVRYNESFQSNEAETGTIHPAVLEYVLGAEEGPLAAYYDLALGLRSPPAAVKADLDTLAPDARKLASGTPHGKDFARALARKLAAPINQALAKETKPSTLIKYTFNGTAGLWWGPAADLERGVLLRDYERAELPGVALRTVVLRHASIDVVEVVSSGTGRRYAWDVAGVPGAFDANATLDYATVAAHIIALHPFTTTPARLP